MPKFLRKNHRSGDYRTGQSTAASLVDAGDAGDTDGAQLPFVTESAAPIHATRIIRRLRRFPTKKFGDDFCTDPELDKTELVPPSFPDRGRFLAFAGAEVI